MKIKLIHGNILDEISKKKTSKVVTEVSKRHLDESTKNILENLDVLVFYDEGPFTAHLLEIRRG
jgi:hypothetical protein